MNQNLALPISAELTSLTCDIHITSPTHVDQLVQLTHLSNPDLEANLKQLIHQERKLLHLILLHIKEVESRRLYLKKAYPSLFEYLTKEYGYSAGSAMRRIEASRLLRDVPQLARQIQSGQVNLSQITEISRAIKKSQKITQRFVSKQEKEDLVLKVAGLSLSETQKVVSLELDIKPKEIEKQRTQQDESVRVEMTLTKQQMQKLNKCKDLAAHLLEQRKMNTSLASVLEVVMDQFLKERGCGAEAEKKKTAQAKGASQAKSTSKMEVNKTLTAKTKSIILKRDLCCQYTDPLTNKKCGSTFKLEIDHKQPRWADGEHRISNLQALCKQHNHFKYKVEAQFIL